MLRIKNLLNSSKLVNKFIYKRISREFVLVNNIFKRNFVYSVGNEKIKNHKLEASSEYSDMDEETADLNEKGSLNKNKMKIETEAKVNNQQVGNLVTGKEVYEDETAVPREFLIIDRNFKSKLKIKINFILI